MPSSGSGLASNCLSSLKPICPGSVLPAPPRQVEQRAVEFDEKPHLSKILGTACTLGDHLAQAELPRCNDGCKLVELLLDHCKHLVERQFRDDGLLPTATTLWYIHQRFLVSFSCFVMRLDLSWVCTLAVLDFEADLS